MSSGTALNRSATRPMSATSKIGASGSLLIATIVRGVLDAGQVLDRAGDADGDVELRRDDLAGLADLELVGDEARVDGRARRAERGAEHVGELGDEPEALGAAERAPAGHDAPRRHQIRPRAAAGAPRHEARVARQRDVEGALLDRAPAALRPTPAYDASRTVATTRRSGSASTVTTALPA